VGLSSLHASSVTLIYNSTSCHVTREFHVAFDESFTSVASTNQGTSDARITNILERHLGSTQTPLPHPLDTTFFMMTPMYTNSPLYTPYIPHLQPPHTQISVYLPKNDTRPLKAPSHLNSGSSKRASMQMFTTAPNPPELHPRHPIPLTTTRDYPPIFLHLNLLHTPLPSHHHPREPRTFPCPMCTR
jgi:hypothetical protein